MSARRTYWHLSALGRKPSEYDIASSELLYHAQRGFELQTPVTAWFQQYQAGSALRSADWERFRDPRATTYASYVALQRKQEIYGASHLEMNKALVENETWGRDEILTRAETLAEKAGLAIDRGVVISNVNDGYTGKAPDLGAFEAGQPLPIYGPRPLQ